MPTKVTKVRFCLNENTHGKNLQTLQGIPEEELLRQQQELFAQARAQQLQVNWYFHYKKTDQLKIFLVTE